MKPHRRSLCLILCIGLLCVPALSEETPTRAEEGVRTALTITGAALGVLGGTATALGFSAHGMDTPLSSTLLVTIPVAAAGAATGALAGWCIAEATLALQPSLLFAPILGAGLGVLGGAFVGALTFPMMAAIAIPTLDVPEGFWGDFEPIEAIGMAVLSGGVWGGIAGIAVGAVSVTVISAIMDF